jgi:hypothetical protein
LQKIRDFLKGFGEAFRDQSTEYIEFELKELENVFALVLMGSFVGIPSPPTTLVLRLMPYMADEIRVMESRAVNLDDVFAQVAGMFDID